MVLCGPLLLTDDGKRLVLELAAAGKPFLLVRSLSGTGLSFEGGGRLRGEGLYSGIQELKLAGYVYLERRGTNVWYGQLTPRGRAAAAKLAEPPSAPPAKVTVGAKRRGRTQNLELHANVAGIVRDMGLDEGQLAGRLDDICERLDDAHIPHPSGWPKGGWGLMTVGWDQRDKALKQIRYQLKMHERHR